MDNFSKTCARSIPTLRGDVYNSCLWTAETIFPCIDEKVSDNIRVNEIGDIIPAMPDDLFLHQDRILSGLLFKHAEGRLLFDKSLVNQYDIRSIPLKIDTRIFQSMKRVVDDVKNKLEDIQPDNLLDENIGSNTGLLKILRDLYVRSGIEDDKCTRYMSLNVDENIFFRILKVC